MAKIPLYKLEKVKKDLIKTGDKTTIEMILKSSKPPKEELKLIIKHSKTYANQAAEKLLGGKPKRKDLVFIKNNTLDGKIFRKAEELLPNTI